MIDYRGVEVIVKQKALIEAGGDPLVHPVDVMTIGVKKGGMGAWISVAQIVSLLARSFGHDMLYELDFDAGETELTLRGGE